MCKGVAGVALPIPTLLFTLSTTKESVSTTKLPANVVVAVPSLTDRVSV